MCCFQHENLGKGCKERAELQGKPLQADCAQNHSGCGLGGRERPTPVSASLAVGTLDWAQVGLGPREKEWGSQMGQFGSLAVTLLRICFLNLGQGQTYTEKQEVIL